MTEHRILKCYLHCVVFIVNRSITSQSQSSLGMQMKIFNEGKQFRKVLELFDLHKNNLSTDSSNLIISQVLKACTQLGDLSRGIDIHRLFSSRIEDDQYIVTSLIHMYMQFGKVKTAELLFNQCPTKDTPMYGAMIKGYITQKMYKQAIDLFRQVKNPSDITTLLLFNACAQLKTREALDLVKEVSSNLPKSFYLNSRFSTSLLDSLMKCGDIHGAESIFIQRETKTSSMYNAMMTGYVNHGMFEKVIDYFQEIKHIDEVNVVLLFKACSHLTTKEALDIVKKVSSTMPQSFYSNAYVLTSLIHVLMKKGEVETAETIFNRASIKNTPMQGAMMKGYVTNQMFKKAIDLYHQIPNPDKINTVIFFNACAQLKTKDVLDMVKMTAVKMPESFSSDPHVLTSLVDALMKCGALGTAETIFNRAKTKDLPMHGAMMNGYVTNQMFKKAIDLYHQIPNPDKINTVIFFNACAQLKTKDALDMVKMTAVKMPKSFSSDPRVMISLVNALIECGDIEMAESLLYQTTVTDVSLFCLMMSGYVKNDDPCQAIHLFQKIKQKGLLLPDDHKETNKEIIASNQIIYLLVIDALVNFGDLSTSELIVKQIPRSFLVHPQVQGALTHMWGKIGSVDKAEENFHNTRQVNQYGYSTMINAYGLNGRGKQAVDLYHRVPQEYIDEITHVCVLNACSHSGLIDDARQIFDNISHPTAKITTTMVDCLSRGGLLDEAKRMIDQFEESSTPSLTMHMTLLSGCRNYKNSHLAEEVYNRMIKHFPTATDSMAAATVLMANTAALSGDMSKASCVRKHLEQSDMKKSIGLSWTTVNGKFYKFCAHDQSHPRSSEIYDELNRISDEIIQLGHKYDASWITKPLKPGETIASVLCSHSERLAIAWNFVENFKTTRIQVTKNLRVCGDCHAATKLIALARQCDIIVRDANRIHHFRKDGTCSCNDYF